MQALHILLDGMHNKSCFSFNTRSLDRLERSPGQCRPVIMVIVRQSIFSNLPTKYIPGLTPHGKSMSYRCLLWIMSFKCGIALGVILTHWGWDKIDSIWYTILSGAFSWMKSYVFWLRFHWSLFFSHKYPIDNIPALVQTMAWHRKGDKPLSEPMLTQFVDAYMRH